MAGPISKSEKEKIDILCYTMGEKSEEILSQVFTELDEDSTYAEVKGKFDGYFLPKKNTNYEIYKLYSRMQLAKETTDEFITALHTLEASCVYGDLKDDLIRDRIVIGIRDTSSSGRLQLTSDLTLTTATGTVR